MPASWSASTPSRTIPAARWPASRCSAHWKRAPIVLGGGDYCAPGQLVGDFLRRPRLHRRSARWSPPTSPACTWATWHHRPARTTRSTAIREALPGVRPADPRLRRADAVLTGVETRTSSPMRITPRRRTAEPEHARPVSGRRRRRLCRRHPVRRRVDGIKVAEAVAKSILSEAGAVAEAGAAAAQPNTRSGALP